MKRLLLLTIILSFVPATSLAEGEVQFEFGGGQAYFAGKPYKSLAPRTGTAIRFGAGGGRKTIFKWVSAFTFITSGGEAGFHDNGTDVDLNYSLLAGEFSLGFKIAPLAPLERLPVQPYVGAAGAATSASFKFADDAAVSNEFPKTDANNFYGYSIFVGVDIELGREWGVNFLVDQTKQSGTVATKQYLLDANRVFINFFFR